VGGAAKKVMDNPMVGQLLDAAAAANPELGKSIKMARQAVDVTQAVGEGKGAAALAKVASEKMQEMSGPQL